MTSARRNRDAATERLRTVLERVCSGGRYESCVTELWVFGSYARGAPRVGDLDLDAELEETTEVAREGVDLMFAGRDPMARFRKALRGNSRSVQLVFGFAKQLGPDAVLVYRRGDSLEDAVARVDAISEDESAGRAPRDPMHPALQPFADDLTRPSRIMLTELAAHGLIGLEAIALPDAELHDITCPDYERAARYRWARGSPLARAARAGGKYLQDRGVDLGRVHLLGVDVRDRDTPWVVECREGKLKRLVYLMGKWGVEEWVFILRPHLKRPLRALRIEAKDPSGLADISDVDRWLAEHAPHISRIG
jgi:hypothetical protein